MSNTVLGLHVLPVATVLILIIAIVGAVLVITGGLDFYNYVKVIGPPAGLLAIGRGFDTGQGARP